MIGPAATAAEAERLPSAPEPYPVPHQWCHFAPLSLAAKFRFPGNGDAFEQRLVRIQSSCAGRPRIRCCRDHSAGKSARREKPHAMGEPALALWKKLINTAVKHCRERVIASGVVKSFASDAYAARSSNCTNKESRAVVCRRARLGSLSNPSRAAGCSRAPPAGAARRRSDGAILR